MSLALRGYLCLYKPYAHRVSGSNFGWDPPRLLTGDALSRLVGQSIARSRRPSTELARGAVPGGTAQVVPQLLLAYAQLPATAFSLPRTG